MAAASSSASFFRILRSRWTSVAVSFYMLLFSGATYIFGVYSGSIKSALHYNQETIDTISFFKDLGGNVGILAGLMNEVSPPWMVLSVGAALNLFGYLMIWLSVTHRVAVPAAGAVCFYMYAAANSQTFANTAVLVACVKNFPLSRGIVLGLTKGCIGLSGAVFVQIYHAIYGQDTTDMILFLGWLPALVILAFMFFVRRMEPDLDQDHDRHFFFLLYLALALAGFLTVAIILENALSVPVPAYRAMGAVTVLLVAANALVVVRAEWERRRRRGGQDPVNVEALETEKKQQDRLVMITSGENLQEEKPSSVSDESCSATKEKKHHEGGEGEHDESMGERTTGEQYSDENSKLETTAGSAEERKGARNGLPASESMTSDGQQHLTIASSSSLRMVWKVRAYWKQWPERGEDHSIAQAMLSLDMWILFASVTCGVGGSLAAVDNMGQIGESLGYSKVRISTCVSLISIWNFLGRVSSGFGSEYLLRRHGVSRALVLSAILGLSSLGHLLIAFPGPGTLYVASILVGFCFGAMWPPLYAVISEIFGLKYFATLYNVVGTVSPLGSYLFNVKVAGYLYDRAAKQQASAQKLLLLMAAASPSSSPPPPADLTCYGTHCFRLAFSIIAVAAFAGCLISLLLVFRTRKFYSQDIYAKLRRHPQQQSA